MHTTALCLLVWMHLSDLDPVALVTQSRSICCVADVAKFTGYFCADYRL